MVGEDDWLHPMTSPALDGADTDTKLTRQVAITILPPSLAAESDRRTLLQLVHA